MRKIDRTRSTYSEVIYGCGVGIYCKGICAESHKKTCPCFYKYKWEFNKKYPHGKIKIELKDGKMGDIFSNEKQVA